MRLVEWLNYQIPVTLAGGKNCLFPNTNIPFVRRIIATSWKEATPVDHF